jgi:peptidyl-prolyl cis-trans isomerase SurA
VRKNQRFSFITCLLSVFVLTHCFLALSQRVYAEVVDRVVAVVNGSVITFSELNANVAMAVKEVDPANREKDIVSLRNSMLDQLIESKLVEQASAKAGITVSEKEIGNAIEDVKKQNNLSQDALMMALANSGLTYKEYKEQLRGQIRQIKFANMRFRSKANISNGDVENYYRQKIDKFYGPPSYRFGIITFHDKEEKKAEEMANDFLNGLKDGKGFGELAKIYSDAPNISGDGDLGYLNAGEMDKAIEDVAERLLAGEISNVIKTSSGLSVIKLIDKKEGVLRPLDDVRDEIYSMLFQNIIDERYRVWLEEMKERSHIDVRL